MSSEDPPKAPTGTTKSDSDKDKDTVWTPQVRRKFETKHKSEYLDPCQEAAARSIRCLHRNGGDKALCQDYFQAYRDCKKEWQEKRLEDKRRKRQESGGGWFS